MQMLSGSQTSSLIRELGSRTNHCHESQEYIHRRCRDSTVKGLSNSSVKPEELISEDETSKLR